mmetsp:Transcript_3701/g.7667  ORF Transcript_3701/g.7667 Transcript_3701/m.7667 type:complete len:255 (+) Transcript_3701:570-1334(+)
MRPNPGSLASWSAGKDFKSSAGPSDETLPLKLVEGLPFRLVVRLVHRLLLKLLLMGAPMRPAWAPFARPSTRPLSPFVKPLGPADSPFVSPSCGPLVRLLRTPGTGPAEALRPTAAGKPSLAALPQAALSPLVSAASFSRSLSLTSRSDSLAGVRPDRGSFESASSASSMTPSGELRRSRCRRFWNQNWICRGETWNSVASRRRMSAVGNLSSWKTSSSRSSTCLVMFHLGILAVCGLCHRPRRGALPMGGCSY